MSSASRILIVRDVVVSKKRLLPGGDVRDPEQIQAQEEAAIKRAFHANNPWRSFLLNTRV